MRCYDCATETHQDTVASASCSVCGAGLCVEHAVQGYAQETVQANIGNPAAYRLPGRRLFCRACAPEYLGTVAIPFRVASAAIA